MVEAGVTPDVSCSHVVINLNPIRYDRSMLKSTLEHYLARRDSWFHRCQHLPSDL